MGKKVPLESPYLSVDGEYMNATGQAIRGKKKHYKKYSFLKNNKPLTDLAIGGSYPEVTSGEPWVASKRKRVVRIGLQLKRFLAPTSGTVYGKVLRQSIIFTLN